MSENLAKAIAAELGGEAWNSGGNIWLVRWDRPDGSVAMMDDDGVEEYDSWADFEEGNSASYTSFARA